MIKENTPSIHLAFPSRQCRRLLGPSFLPPIWLGLFTTISYGTSFQNCCKMRFCRLDSVMVHAWCCSATFSSHCLHILEERVSGTCVARGGPTAWPAGSSACNPLHCYLWGHLKFAVCATDVSDVQDLQRRTQNGSEMIRKRAGVLGRVWQSLFRRTTSCVETQRGHFENLL